ncbi:hypothetical protein XENORESO_017047, partial [Xenotaenia resolanae]
SCDENSGIIAIFLCVCVCVCVCVCQAPVTEVKRARGDVPDILPEPEPEPTSQVSDFENSYNYVLSRLAGIDQAIHKLNVGHYTLDVKVSQLIDRISRLDAKVGDLEDSIQEVYQHSKDNRKEIGRLEGIINHL